MSLLQLKFILQLQLATAKYVVVHLKASLHKPGLELVTVSEKPWSCSGCEKYQK